MRQLLNFLLSDPRILIAIIFLGAPVVKAILKAIQKNKDERRRRLALERAREEALRTGRPEPVGTGQARTMQAGPVEAMPQSPASQAAGAVAARRRMEELAARRAAAQRASTPARPIATGPSMRSPTPATPAPPATPGQSTASPGAPQSFKLRLPNGMEIQLPMPGGETGPAPRPRQAETRREKRARREGQPRAESARSEETARSADAAQRAEAARRAEREQERRSTPKPVEEGRAVVMASSPVGQRSGLRLGGVGTWRRAIIMAEVLGTPPGLR